MSLMKDISRGFKFWLWLLPWAIIVAVLTISFPLLGSLAGPEGALLMTLVLITVLIVGTFAWYGWILRTKFKSRR